MISCDPGGRSIVECKHGDRMAPHSGRPMRSGDMALRGHGRTCNGRWQCNRLRCDADGDCGSRPAVLKHSTASERRARVVDRHIDSIDR